MNLHDLEREVHNLEDKTVADLKKLVSDLEVEGRSTLTTKDELVNAVRNEYDKLRGNNVKEEEKKDEPTGQTANDGNQTPSDDTPTVGHDSPASDEDNPEVVANLSPSGKEAFDHMTDAQKEEADLALDASGPLHLQDPAERVMTGAVSEKQAKEQEELTKDLPEDHVGDVTEVDEPLSKPGDEVKQPHEVAEEEGPAPLAERERAAYGMTIEEAHKDDEVRASDHGHRQVAVLQTDGNSRESDHNLARAYNLEQSVPVADRTAEQGAKLRGQSLGDQSEGNVIHDNGPEREAE